MKRFTETTKWTDPWFQDLTAENKLFWLYILDNCDNAGVWNVNLKLASFQLGAEFDAKTILAAFSGRIEDLGNGYWWMPKFCDFQYGKLKRDCIPHKKVIEILKKYGVFDRLKLEKMAYE